MYQRIYNAYSSLSKGDQAELKRCNLSKLANCPAYFRVLRFSGAKDTTQTQRILFLMTSIDVSQESEAQSVALALLKAGVKESQIIQITRSGDNAIEYLKRQLVRCKQVQLESLGKLAQFWGENSRRQLLKEFILAEQD
ncbi:type I-E CRISPR-associated protein Cse2/CasB [Pseudoalteromonas sp. SG43-7]|jgi:CRISPR system Cascade subunit CasB|uniref:Type I-E CRISPR-associated protein Cse2/CasB n=1 Tax=Pseudoalteromonas neustonica TaxID=1840331 RepID=A0ABY3FIR6_9GAMM|nr:MULTISPECIES: type I-E CRISPR-associated protein Cse2/CasB [Pseudoalteromonas]MBB1408031.1 type I-E CRISPR-associated protein Cse2/CasB [Pseudoalteromonas sp. SG44-17]MBB1422215.1 type I-E CRISPR-associated protein Cse2/CasB [Pseudoalteromonas sp. SG43-7]MBB1471053.1 type I-E CRISPR-associated protein Cse2/CasB [Pseudoalteromonas sp. SG41-5]MBB1480358.1 type I-E CRISPR-associated protein Cse2/CasB [Pseudoalteromonas sp. SG41-2]MBB1504396.1 type I-E CRISPR-associated protein Cse2/CasB [Pseud|tara:strand:- start:47 stop:463 length:417 start_codon:yes stop_codon:yes gene_type:complete